MSLCTTRCWRLKKLYQTLDTVSSCHTAFVSVRTQLELFRAFHRVQLSILHLLHSVCLITSCTTQHNTATQNLTACGSALLSPGRPSPLCKTYLLKILLTARSYQASTELMRGLDQDLLSLSLCLLQHVGLHVIPPTCIFSS